MRKENDYEDLNHVYMCRTSTGMGNLVGNVTMIIRNFIKGLFPTNFFQDEFIDTQMAQTEMSEILTKKKKPCLVVRPKFSIDDDTVFGKLPDWTNTNYFIYKKLKGNYLPVLYDTKNQIYMYTNCDRIKMTFDIEILLDSKLQQINTAYYLKGSVLHKSYFYMDNSRLECEIPKYYMKQIAGILNMNLKDEEERAEFNNYLNQNSQDYITEKVKLGSGNYSHFYMFSSNLLCLFENNPEIDDGENQGMTLNNFKITDSLTVETWCPMTFFLEVGRKFKMLEYENEDVFNIMTESKNITVHYTTQFKIPPKYGDMKYYTKTMVITDKDPEKDVVDISSLFTRKDKQIVDFALNHKDNLDEIFHVDLYLDKKLVDRDSIMVNWDTFEVINIRPKINDCYTLVLYKGYEKFNRLIRKMDHLTEKEYN